MTDRNQNLWDALIKLRDGKPISYDEFVSVISMIGGYMQRAGSEDSMIRMFDALFESEGSEHALKFNRAQVRILTAMGLPSKSIQ